MPNLDTETRVKLFEGLVEYIVPEERELASQIFVESCVFHNPHENDLEIQDLTQEDAEALKRISDLYKKISLFRLWDSKEKIVIKEFTKYIAWRLKQPLTD